MPLEKLILLSEIEYKTYYEDNYCKNPLITSDGIKIYFQKSRFSHAFFESSDRRGSNDVFSFTRAERMDWIKMTLTSESATLYQGWIKSKGAYDPTSRVAFEFEEFVVIVRLSLNKKGELKGNFITCYQANNSIGKIKSSPLWKKEDCLSELSE